MDSDGAGVSSTGVRGEIVTMAFGVLASSWQWWLECVKCGYMEWAQGPTLEGRFT